MIARNRGLSPITPGGLSPITPMCIKNVALRVAAGAVVGGVVSRLAGGKFENGAITGAFAYLFSSAAAAEEKGAGQNLPKDQLACSKDCDGFMGSGGRNNVLVATDFNEAEWDWRGSANETNGGTITINTGDRIALRFSSIASPTTNQFWVGVTATPLNLDGSIQASITNAGFYAPVSYSSGPTGAGFFGLVQQRAVFFARTFSLRNQWTISIPPQQSGHDNASGNMVEIFTQRK